MVPLVVPLASQGIQSMVVGTSTSMRSSMLLYLLLHLAREALCIQIPSLMLCFGTSLLASVPRGVQLAAAVVEGQGWHQR